MAIKKYTCHLRHCRDSSPTEKSFSSLSLTFNQNSESIRSSCTCSLFQGFFHSSAIPMALAIRDEEDCGAPVNRGTAMVPYRPDDEQKKRNLSRDLNTPAVPEAHVIRWERFLPRRFLRVLLVENDDSTRHLVTALLRKCSYQVAAVADGLKAWEILKEKHYNFDLVLTEVVMPSLSGIGLLCKIMNAEICKNIPVIMMSSHDSVSIVFKCMLKGAADFLVKPVRKNELRNLWQHVWRKHCIRSRNGSDNENPDLTKQESTSDNNSASNHASANPVNSPTSSDSSNKGSDTQSSVRKPEVDTEGRSLQNQGEPIPMENKSSPRETCLTLENYSCDFAKSAAISSMHGNGDLQDKLTGIETKVTLSSQAPFSTVEIRKQNNFCGRSPCRENESGSSSCKHGAKMDPDPLNHNGKPNEPSTMVIDFIGAITTGPNCSLIALEECGHREDVPSEAAKISDGKNDASDAVPLWELSLRRPRFSGWDKQELQERQHVLNHSDASAFSRYGKNGIHLSCPRSGPFPDSLHIRSIEQNALCRTHSGNDGTCNGNEEDIDPPVGDSSGKDPYVGCSSSRDATVLSHPPVGFLALPIPVGSIPFESLCAGYRGFLQPTFHSETGLSLLNPALEPKGSDKNDIRLVHHPQAVNCNPGDQNHHPNQFEQGVKDQNANIDTRGPNGSGSNGSSEGTDAVLNNGAALETSNEDGFQSGNGSGVDLDQSARRMAALIKFRLKRKDRCFEKKVRYHSRKKLAEQRPRLKGQFVRQEVVESTIIASETYN